MPADKQRILDEIRRTAAANGGVPLGKRRFSAETGIGESEWIGKVWARWGDAVKEAGFKPNQMVKGHGEKNLLIALAGYVRELGSFPSANDLRLRSRRGDGFPTANTFQRIGVKQELLSKMLALLKNDAEWADVVAICKPLIEAPAASLSAGTEISVADGFVYLIQSARRYKIGATNNLASRGKAIAVQMPDPTTTVHVIRTDDPFGIEAYWHKRFADKRTNGEWFDLDRAEVAAFKRRKTM
jgi:hypothetical protein